MEETIRYLIAFLVRDEAASQRVGYTSDTTAYARYALVIRPSGWLDQVADPSQAQQPDPFDFQGVPALFGTPDLRREGNIWVVGADWIASTYYLVTRYEEWQHPLRDVHGRYPGKNSLLNRLDWLQRPLVEAYSRQLRSLLEQTVCELSPLPTGRLVLTHDIDAARRFHSLLSQF